MNIIYKVTDTLNNLSYIGSKMNYVEGSSYLGSPSCREGHPKYEVHGQIKVKLCLQGITKTINNVTLKLK